MTAARLPILDMTPLRGPAPPAERDRVARSIADACRHFGFFYLVGHGLDPAAVHRLEVASRRFFAAPLADKLAIAMARGGRAWRGYFPLGDELTSGQPDHKEGLYFGAELAEHHPRVRAGMPLHGANLWPAHVPELRPAVLDFMATMSDIAQRLLTGIARSLDVGPLPRPAAGVPDDQAERWDRASVHAFRGTYGDYLLAKIARVFPDLQAGLSGPA